MANKMVELKGLLENLGCMVQGATDGMEKVVAAVADTTKATVTKSQTVIINAIDQNGDGKLDIEDIIIMGLHVPGVRINRADFLQKEFQKNFSQEIIDDAIRFNPLHANIPAKEIDRIADEVIKYERNCVSGISAALGMPGGMAMAATIPADIAQYYGYMFRAMQKLMYLYGFPEIDMEEQGQTFDSETLNTLTICLGIMYGVARADGALKAIAKALSRGVPKQLMKKALTKGTIYPIVKSVAKWFGVKMTKDVFTGFFKKAIPVVGGGLTFATFKQCCDLLKKSLQNTKLSNANYNSAIEDDDLIISDDGVIVAEILE